MTTIGRTKNTPNCVFNYLIYVLNLDVNLDVLSITNGFLLTFLKKLMKQNVIRNMSRLSEMKNQLIQKCDGVFDPKRCGALK